MMIQVRLFFRSKVPSSLEARHSLPVSHNTDKQVKPTATGRLSFPGVRLVSPLITLDPIPQSITTSYASLISDKLPSNQTLVHASKSSLPSVASQKSVFFPNFGGMK